MTNQSASFFSEILLRIYPCKTPFRLKILHKKPKTLMGSYTWSTQVIRIYDGWGDTQVCTETAIHEYAHHLHQTEFGKEKYRQKPHGKQFWQIYGQLMQRAKDLGLYDDPKNPVLDFPSSQSL